MNINFAGLLDTLVNLAELHIDIDINSCYPIYMALAFQNSKFNIPNNSLFSISNCTYKYQYTN